MLLCQGRLEMNRLGMENVEESMERITLHGDTVQTCHLINKYVAQSRNSEIFWLHEKIVCVIFDEVKQSKWAFLHILSVVKERKCGLFKLIFAINEMNLGCIKLIFLHFICRN